jgi:hypothetical protein
MISFNSPNISQQSNTGILINQHITARAVGRLREMNMKATPRNLSVVSPVIYRISVVGFLDVNLSERLGG